MRRRTSTITCVVCGATEEYKGVGRPPNSCSKHRSSYGHATCFCGVKFVKTHGNSTRCPEHHGWRKCRPPRVRASAGSVAQCNTCTESFTKLHAASKYCCEDHNPNALTRAERRALLVEFPAAAWRGKYQI